MSAKKDVWAAFKKEYLSIVEVALAVTKINQKYNF